MKNINILYIDDLEADAVFFREMLKAAGAPMTLHHAESSENAKAFLARTGAYAQAAIPDIILLDVSLPRRNGYEILHDIRSDAATRHIPVIMFSGSSLDKDVMQSYASLANAHVRKPRDFDEMQKFISAFTAFWGECALLPPKEGRHAE